MGIGIIWEHLDLMQTQADGDSRVEVEGLDSNKEDGDNSREVGDSRVGITVDGVNRNHKQEDGASRVETTEGGVSKVGVMLDGVSLRSKVDGASRVVGDSSCN